MELVPNMQENPNHNDNNNNGGISSATRRYFASIPPGYRFRPTDEELIVYYLLKKINNQPLPLNLINQCNVYEKNPQQLAEEYHIGDERDMYFFTPRSKKYRNGNRPARAAGNGYWKATGADKDIFHNNILVGARKSLVFYIGKAPTGTKTSWIMQEFRLNKDTPQPQTNEEDIMRLDYVLCRIYNNSSPLVVMPRYLQLQGIEAHQDEEAGNNVEDHDQEVADNTTSHVEALADHHNNAQAAFDDDNAPDQDQQDQEVLFDNNNNVVDQLTNGFDNNNNNNVAQLTNGYFERALITSNQITPPHSHYDDENESLLFGNNTFFDPKLIDGFYGDDQINELTGAPFNPNDHDMTDQNELIGAPFNPNDHDMANQNELTGAPFNPNDHDMACGSFNSNHLLYDPNSNYQVQKTMNTVVVGKGMQGQLTRDGQNNIYENADAVQDKEGRFCETLLVDDYSESYMQHTTELSSSVVDHLQPSYPTQDNLGFHGITDYLDSPSNVKMEEDSANNVLQEIDPVQNVWQEANDVKGHPDKSE